MNEDKAQISQDNNIKPISKKSLLSPSGKFLQLTGILIAIVVVFVIFFSDFNIFETNTKSSETINSFEEYVLNLEAKVANTIKDIEGVGNAPVAITFESNVEKIFAYETITETSNGLTSQELILYKGEPIVIKENMPLIKGVVVVAKGATNAVVRLNIIRTVQILLGVTYDKIEVFAYKT